MYDSNAGIDFFNDKTEVIKRCLSVNYKHDLKAIISYEFSYNDNKITYEYYIKVQSIINLFKRSQVFRYTLYLHDVQKLTSVPYSSLLN